MCIAPICRLLKKQTRLDEVLLKLPGLKGSRKKEWKDHGQNGMPAAGIAVFR